jgi:hypothetical protein
MTTTTTTTVGNLYRVTFTFDSSYRPKTEGIVTVGLVVRAEDQFTALSSAWAKLTSLNLPEPVEFNAVRADKE